MKIQVKHVVGRWWAWSVTDSEGQITACGITQSEALAWKLADEAKAG